MTKKIGRAASRRRSKRQKRKTSLIQQTTDLGHVLLCPLFLPSFLFSSLFVTVNFLYLSICLHFVSFLFPLLLFLTSPFISLCPCALHFLYFNLPTMYIILCSYFLRFVSFLTFYFFLFSFNSIIFVSLSICSIFFQCICQKSSSVCSYFLRFLFYECLCFKFLFSPFYWHSTPIYNFLSSLQNPIPQPTRPRHTPFIPSIGLQSIPSLPILLSRLWRNSAHQRANKLSRKI
jgi:hypothetical protein